MSIEHHPPDEILAAFTAGSLDHGQHIGVATHLVACQKCRDFVCSIEQIGGAVLSELPPAPMSNSALAEVELRLNEVELRLNESAQVAVAAPALPKTEMPGLPEFVRRYRFGRWKWVAPSVYVRPIELPYSSSTRVFLLKSAPGTKMLQHTHTGIEMTCVLSGAFRQDGIQYSPGDFDLGDQTINHRPVVEHGQDCVCLVAMQGKLRLKGLMGWIVQPLVRL
jgi:putative transcriptional regulator